MPRFGNRRVRATGGCTAAPFGCRAVGADRPGLSRACEAPPICSAVEQPEQEIGQQDDLARCGRIVVLNLSVTARVLEHARS